MDYKYNEQNEKRLKDFLKEECRLSRRTISAIFHENRILVNGTVVPLTRNLKWNDIVTIKEKEITILYETNTLLAVEKPSGICVHPTKEHPKDDLLTLLEYKFDQKLYPITRIDRLVSGIVLYAKSHKAASFYNYQRITMELSKEYMAVCEGHFNEKIGTLKFQLGKEKGKRGKTICSNGAPCEMDYIVEKDANSYSILKIHLKTGRTHQIRAGLASLGHPLLGDSLYNGDTRQMKRPALHCSIVKWKDMDTMKQVVLECAIPKDMEDL